MKAADVMSTNVITVGPDASVQNIARILLSYRISAVPVVADDGALLGIVSEGDLIHHADAGTARKPSWWLDLVADNRGLAAEYIKSHARRAADLMTHPVITARPDTELGEIAKLLERNGIKRVPIVDNGKVVGIVSRANLIQALASLHEEVRPAEKVDDAKVRERVIARLRAEPWRPTMLNVTVRNGTVDLWGIVDSDTERTAARVAAEITPGVRMVVDNLLVRPRASSMM
jgi:CBS domain-containing protein